MNSVKISSVLISIVMISTICSLAKCQQCVAPQQPLDLPTRADQSTNMALLKVLELNNYQQQSYGQSYTVTFELVCSIKVQRGIILPLTFTMADMGDRPTGCPSRTVAVSEQYVVFLTRDVSGAFVLEEVNQQEGVIVASWDNMKALSSQVQSCLTGDCRPSGEGWVPMSELERAELAQMIVWVEVIATTPLSTSGTYIADTRLICAMKDDNGGETPSELKITNVGALYGSCQDRHVTVGHQFIIFLERHYPFFPLPGQTIAPPLLDNYVLGLDEVNGQHAVFNLTDQTRATFDSYLAGCPGAGVALTGGVFRVVAAAVLVVVRGHF